MDHTIADAQHSAASIPTQEVHPMQSVTLTVAGLRVSDGLVVSPPPHQTPQVFHQQAVQLGMRNAHHW